MKGEFTTVIQKSGDWYIGYIEEIPGVNTQGKTLDEVRENLKEAFKLIIEANQQLTHKSLADDDVIRETTVLEWEAVES